MTIAQAVARLSRDLNTVVEATLKRFDAFEKRIEALERHTATLPADIDIKVDMLETLVDAQAEQLEDLKARLRLQEGV